jgi:peptide/nickel transport system substrate-binding protein
MRRFISLAFSLLLVSIFAVGALAQELIPNPKILSEDLFVDGLGVRGGQVVIDNVDNPRTFNPIVQFESSSDAINAHLHATLLEQQGTIDGLAEAAEVSEDGLSITLLLREGLKFSDGEPLTSADVLFTLNDVVFNPDVVSRKTLWIINDEFPTVTAPDERTVVVTTSVPAVNVMTINLLLQEILPRHKLADSVSALNANVPPGAFNEAWNIGTPVQDIVGAGPFRIKSFTADQQVVLERNPFFWKVDPEGTQLPYLDEIVLPVFSDDNVRLLRYINGETDIYGPTPEDLPVLQQRADEGIELLVGTQASTLGDDFFAFNQDASNPNLRQLFRDVRFRQAMSHALDRDAIIDLFRNTLAEARFGPGMSSAFWFGVQDAADFPRKDFDLTMAENLLDQLDISDGDGDGIREFGSSYPNPGEPVEFELVVPEGTRVLIAEADFWSQDLDALGIRANLNPISFNTLVGRLIGSRPAEYEAVRIAIGGGGDPNLAADIYASTGPLHFYKFSDATRDDVPDYQQRIDELFSLQAITEGEQRFQHVAECAIDLASQRFWTGFIPH